MSFDLASAILVFLFMLFFLFSSWSTNVDNWNKWQRTAELEQRSQAVAKVLTESPGFPRDWNSTDINVVGLALQSNVLSSQKIAAFVVMDYNTARQKLNIMAFDFWVEIVADNGPNPSIDHNIGADAGLANSVASVDRRVLIGGENAVFRFKLFR